MPSFVSAQKARARDSHDSRNARPSVDVISGLIKANASRVALQFHQVQIHEPSWMKWSRKSCSVEEICSLNQLMKISQSDTKDRYLRWWCQTHHGFIKSSGGCGLRWGVLTQSEVSEKMRRASDGWSWWRSAFEEAKALVIETRKPVLRWFGVVCRLDLTVRPALWKNEMAGVISPAEGTKPRKYCNNKKWLLSKFEKKLFY